MGRLAMTALHQTPIVLPDPVRLWTPAPHLLRPMSRLAELKLPRPVLYAPFDSDKTFWKPDGSTLSPTTDTSSSLIPARFGNGISVATTAAGGLAYSNATFPVDPGTVTCWIKYATAFPSSLQMGVLELRVATPAFNLLRLYLQKNDAADLLITVRCLYVTPTDNFFDLGSDQLYYFSQEVFVGLSWNGPDLRLYVNDSKKSLTVSGVRNANPGTTFSVGCFRTQTNRNLGSSGWITEMAVFNSGLTDEEIWAIRDLSHPLRGTAAGD